MYKENTIGDKLKKGKRVMWACMVLCSIGAVASLIAYGVNMSTYNEEKDYVKYYLNGGCRIPAYIGRANGGVRQTDSGCLFIVYTCSGGNSNLIPDFVWRHVCG